MASTYTLLVTFSVAAYAPPGTAPIAPQITPGLTFEQCKAKELEVRKLYRPLPYRVDGRCKPEPPTR